MKTTLLDTFQKRNGCIVDINKLQNITTTIYRQQDQGTHVICSPACLPPLKHNLISGVENNWICSWNLICKLYAVLHKYMLYSKLDFESQDRTWLKHIVVITFPLQHNDVNRSVMLLSRMPLDSYIERVLFTEPYRPCAHCLIQGNIFAYCPSLKCF